jgi:hypothetical protein
MVRPENNLEAKLRLERTERPAYRRPKPMLIDESELAACNILASSLWALCF